MHRIHRFLICLMLMFYKTFKTESLLRIKIMKIMLLTYLKNNHHSKELRIFICLKISKEFGELEIQLRQKHHQ